MMTVLSNEQRHHALAYLLPRTGPVPLGNLAEYIAAVEGDRSNERFERIQINLHHHHLPMIAERGIVDYDAERKLISLTVVADGLRPYLTLTGGSDP